MNIFPTPSKLIQGIKSKCSMSHKNGLFMISFVLLISACSFKTLYNRLDYLIPGYVEGMVSLDDVLEEKLEQRTDILISWHRNTQLIQYAELLRTFQQDIQSPLDEQRVFQYIASIQRLWRALELKINQEMAELLPLLNAKQRDELFDSIDDKNEDFYEEYVDIDSDERIEQYTETTLDSYQNWLGTLTAEQERGIEKAVTELESGAAFRLVQRRLWQRNIRDILDTDDTEKLKTERLMQFFERFNINDQPQLKAVSEANKSVLARLTVEIINQATAEQKTFFKNKTDEYIQMFTELAENR